MVKLALRQHTRHKCDVPRRLAVTLRLCDGPGAETELSFPCRPSADTKVGCSSQYKRTYGHIPSFCLAVAS